MSKSASQKSISERLRGVEMSKPPKTGAEKIFEEKLDDFSDRETEKLVTDFQSHFRKCVEACKKPNILVSGITGSGKSTLINAIFGKDVTKSGVGMPVTQVFEKFSPKNKPIVLYDSKGLEWNEHEKFIKETSKFFMSLRAKKEVADHIHCIWFVINAGRGRIDPFEITLLRDVFAPTPVLFVINKADLADAGQLKALKEVLEEENLKNNKGIFFTVSKRKTYTQGWCPKCLGDDLFFDEETKTLECCGCNHECIVSETFGLEELVERTCSLLPEFAKDAFMYCQEISMEQKNVRCKEIVKGTIQKISLDLKGEFIGKVAEMFAKMFVVWGYPLTGKQFEGELNAIQKEYVKEMKFQQRFIISSLDRIFRKKISRGFTAIIGLTMNKGMKRLNDQLIEHTKGEDKDFEISDFMKDVELDDILVMLFFETALFDGIDVAVDTFWDVTPEQLEEIRKKSRLLGDEGSFQGGGFDVHDEDVMYKLFQDIQGEQERSILMNGDDMIPPRTGVTFEFVEDEEREKEGENEKEEMENDDKGADALEEPDLD